jgi:hypothetical protein
MIPHHVEQDTLRGIVGLVATGGCGHAPAVRVRSASGAASSIRPDLQ